MRYNPHTEYTEIEFEHGEVGRRDKRTSEGEVSRIAHPAVPASRQVLLGRT